MTEQLLWDEVYAVVGAAINVYNELGPGFLEAVYQEALQLELTTRKVPFVPQHELVIFYKGTRLRKTYVADIFAFGSLLVEMKAMSSLTTVEEAQLLNYMKASHVSVGLLLNFGSSKRLQWKRMVRTDTE